MGLLGTEAKGKERRGLSWKSYILKTLFPYSVELFKEESQKISNDTPNTYSVFFCTAVAIRYENQVQTLFWWHPIWVSSSLVIVHSLSSELVILAPILPLSLEVM